MTSLPGKPRSQPPLLEVLPMTALPTSQVNHEVVSDGVGVSATAAEVLGALRAGGERVNRLLAEAEVLGRRAVAVAEDEQILVNRESKVTEREAVVDAELGRLAQREGDVASAELRLRLLQEAVRVEQDRAELERSRLCEEAAQLVEREERYVSRWRWLIHSWLRRPLRPAAGARVCELLFVPSSDGYKLLEQTGVALAPGATLTGLLDEDRSFVVSKISPWPFESRWCAYLQQQPTAWVERTTRIARK